MLTKTQLKELLNVSVSKLEQLMQSAGISADTTSFTEDQVSAIESIIESEQSTSTGKPKPRKGGSIARSENSKPVRRNGERVQHVMSTLTQKGIVQGQMAAKATMEGVAYGYTDSMEMFWDKFEQAAEAETEFTRGLAVSPDPLSLGTEEFVNSFFDGDSLSALQSAPE